MNIDVAKRVVKSNLLVRNRFLYKGNRNRNEEFIGTISKMFPAIFIIELDNSVNKSIDFSEIIL